MTNFRKSSTRNSLSTDENAPDVSAPNASAPTGNSQSEDAFGENMPRENVFSDSPFDESETRESSTGESSPNENTFDENSFGGKSFGERVSHESAFGESAFGGNGDGAAFVEARFPALLLNVISGALLFGGVATCVVMWFLSASQPSSDRNLLRLAGLAVLLTDIMGAAFLRIFLNGTLVRADERGVSRRGGFEQEEVVAWDKIARIESQKIGARVAGFALFDAQENELLRVRPNSRPPLDLAQVVVLIERKLSERR